MELEGFLVSVQINLELALGRIIGHASLDHEDVAFFGCRQGQAVEVAGVQRLGGSLLMRHFALVDDLKTDEVLEVLVGRAADVQVDLGLLAGDLEVPLAKHVVLALLERYEVASVLLAHVVHL